MLHFDFLRHFDVFVPLSADIRYAAASPDISRDYDIAFA